MFNFPSHGRALVTALSFIIIGLFNYAALADVTATKQVFSAETGAPITTADVGQTIEYGLNWSCSFTGAPPIGECGDFTLTDPLPAGTTFIGCSVPGQYSCVEAPAGFVTIELVDGAANFLNGESATASILVELSTDPSDFTNGAPGTLTNTATVDSADGPEDIVANVEINAPTNNWEIDKRIIVPEEPINPALDNPVSYEIEICPQGPSGLGTGTIVIQNPSIIDACPVGAVINSADLDGVPLTFSGICDGINGVDFDLPAEFDPANGCPLITVSMTFPSSEFDVGDTIVNTASLDGDNIDPLDCPNNCTDSVTSELDVPTAGANFNKSNRRNEVSLGAYNQYYISYNTNSSNVQQTGVVISDTFPVNIDVQSLGRTGTWSHPLVTADFIELPSNTVLATGYNGTGAIDPISGTATGFEIRFTTPVPAGFNAGRFLVNYQAPSTGSTGDTYINCAIIDSNELPAPVQNCATVTLIDPINDMSVNKIMPDALTPGSEFSTTFSISSDATSSFGAVNPVLSDCLAEELEFVSWNSESYGGMDSPTSAVNTANTNPRAVAANFEFIPSGAANNTCVGPNSGQLKWSWKASAPAGSVRIDGTPGVANPFTFPVRRDRVNNVSGDPADKDDIGDTTGFLGITVSASFNVTLRLKPSVAAQSGLTNTLEVIPENDNFRCISGSNQNVADLNDIDGDGNTAELTCGDVESYRVLSAAAYSGSKFVAGFPGLPNFDPDFPPADNTAAASNAIVTPASCPVDADGRTRAPCVAQAIEDQPFNYRLRMSNDGNVPIVDYVIYDILPNTDTSGSDIGISESQASTVRGSSWEPLLNGPVMISSANPIVAAELASNAVISYSASSNPCRPELSINDDTGGGDWQSGACVNDWTQTPLADAVTFPNGYASVRAWRLEVPFAGAAGWPIGDPDNIDEEDIVIDLEMLADPNAPGSDYEAVPPVINIAWNNVAFRGTNQDTGRRLLAADATKTGIVSPPNFPLASTGLRIGNLVWSDANNNGIAEAGEQGIFDVSVQLWTDTTGNGPSSDDVLFDTVQTDAFGKYLFDDADLLNRDGLGIPAGDYYVVIPSNQTGAFNFDEKFSSTTSQANADGNLDNDNNGAFDNSVAPIATTDINSPAISGIHSGTVNLAIGDEPINEINRSDDATDDDEDFFEDADSNVSVDFGFYELRLGNHLWLDTNNNGVADSSEPAIENAVVQLFLDNGDGVFDPNVDTIVNTDTTNALGQYLFTGLNVGNYFIAVESGQSGWVAGGTTYATSDLASSTFTSVAGAALANDNQDDGSAGQFGSVTPVNYASVTSLLELTVGGALVNESDSSSNGANGSSATDPSDANAELYNNTLANVAFPDANSYLSADLGFAPAVSLGSTIWHDVNGNGQQDVGEVGLAGVTITLLDSTGVAILDATGLPITAITDASGQYNFNGLPPETYRISANLATSPTANISLFLPSPGQVTNADNNVNTDSNVDATADPNPLDLTYISAPIEVLSGDEPESETDPINAAGDGTLTDPDQPNQTGLADNSGNMSLDMGFLVPVSVGSFVWHDINGDGQQNSNEPPISGSQVSLFVETTPSVFVPALGFDSVAVPTQVVGANGYYLFDVIPPGNYRVQVQPPAGYFPSLVQTIVANDDSENDSNIASEVSTGVYRSETFTILAGLEPIESNATLNRGDAQDGAPGSGSDSSGNMTIDFGFVQAASLGNYVWLDADKDGVQDANEDGIANVIVNLYADTNGDGIVDGAELTTPVATQSTGPNGGYLFSNLEPGIAFIVGVDITTVPTGLIQTFDEGDGLGATDSLSDPIVLAPAEEHLTADFGYAPAAGLGAIGDTIWIDANDDGVQNPGEIGIEGVRVILTPPSDVDLGNGLGQPIDVLTDANGKYLFADLPLDESYIVEVDVTTLPAGYTSSVSGLGDPDVRDGETTVADDRTVVVLTDDSPVHLDADFGYLPADDQNNSIGDTVWLDIDEDGNGPITAGDGSDVLEPVLPGVTVTLVRDGGDGVYSPLTDVVVATTITDQAGMYLFTGLPDGDYFVLITDQNNVLAGMQQTFDSNDPAAPGAFSATTPNQSFVDDLGVGIATPDANLLQDFGYTRPSSGSGDGSIGDTIFFDEDRSGSPSVGEGIEGVTVLLYGPGPDGDITTTGDNELLGSQVTDENGNYLFTGLDTSDTGPNPGTDYQVVVDTSTLPNGGTGWTNTVDPDTANPGDSQSITTLTTTTPIDLDQDFGYVGESQNSLSGTVWPDTDGNGMQDEAGGFSGVTIELRDDAGNVISTTTTDIDGNYSFENLPDGIYVVVVTDEDNVLNGFKHTDSPIGLSDVSDETSKDDTGYRVDLDSAGVDDDPVHDVTSDFGYQPDVTTPISLGSFSTQVVSEGLVQIDWVTQTEVANLGFNVYAQVGQEWVLLNDQLVLSQGDSVRVQSYQLSAETDATIFALSDIDLTGKETLHGPYWLGERHGLVGERNAIDWSEGKSIRAEKRANREAQRRAKQEQRELQRRQKLKYSGETSMLHESSWTVRAVAAVLSAIIPTAHAAQDDSVVNLATTQAGVYEVSYADLVSSLGVDLSGAKVSDIAVINQGKSVPIHVVGSSLDPNVFGAGGSVLFVADAVDTLYTDTNIYTLKLAESQAKRMTIEAPALPAGASAASYLATARYAPQTKYSFVSPNAQDPWYAKRIVAVGESASSTVSLELDNVAIGGNTGSTKARLSVNVWGGIDLPGSENDHHMKVSLNGNPVTSGRFDGLSQKNMTSYLDVVQEGNNRITLELPMDTGQAFDAVSVNEVSIQYPRSFVAKDNRLNFVSNLNKFQISGLESAQLANGADDLLVLRKTGNDLTVINNSTVSCRSTCVAQFGSHAQTSEYFVAARSALFKPEFRALPLDQDINSGQAAYLIISHPDFIDSSSLLQFTEDMRAEFGSAQLVDVDAIYAQYGHHIFDPVAIQEYIRYSASQRGTQYVLLVGGDVYDYRQFENEEAESFIPSIYAATGINISFAPVDAKYVDLDDDNVPDLPIGRLPIRTEAQLDTLLNKRTAYLNRDYRGTALLVADEYDAAQQYDFAADADEIDADYLSNWDTAKVYVDDVLSNGGDVREARQSAVTEINEGQSLTAFFGHSSTNQWAFNGLFTGGDAAGLNNVGKPTVVAQWGCWNTYYVSPNEDSMAHRFMMEGAQGAVAVMGATTLTNADAERRLARMVFARLSNGERLGEAITNAKQAYAVDNPNDLDVLLGWTLLGLPELHVN